MIMAVRLPWRFHFLPLS